MSNQIDALVALLGKEKVHTFCAKENENRSTFVGYEPDAVVTPETDSDVKALVEWAKDTKTTLVPVSSSAPHYKGTTVPSAPHAVLVDMRGRNAILTITREQRIVIVEPGVTYEQLVPELQKNDLAIPMPLAPKAGKSVLASVTELEPRLNCMHSWNAMEPLRCVDVIWGDGTHMFTGDAAGGPMDLEAQHKVGKWQLDSAGPMLVDYYRLIGGSLGTLGFANWVSVRCEVLPKEHVMFFAATDSLEQATDYMYDIMHKRFSDELLLINRTCFGLLTKRDAANLPEWIVLVGVAGRDKAYHLRVEGQTLDLKEMAQARGLQLMDSLGGVTSQEMLQIISTPCAAGDYWKERTGKKFEELIYNTTLDLLPKQLAAMKAEGVYKGAALYVQPLHQGVSATLELVMPYEDGKEAEAKALADRTAEACHKAGAYFSRNYGGYAVSQISDANEKKLLRGVKDIFDPAHVMNTGKLGDLE